MVKNGRSTMDSLLSGHGMIKRVLVPASVVLCGLIAVAVLMVFSQWLVTVESGMVAFAVVLALCSITAVFAVFAARYLFSLKFAALARSLGSLAQARNRHLFIPNKSSQISAAIIFHVEQLLDEIDQLSVELRERETIYDSILNTQDELVFIVDKDGYISYRNRSFDEVFGVPSLEFDKESSIFSETLSVFMQEISPLVFIDRRKLNNTHFLSEVERGNEVLHINWAVNRVPGKGAEQVLFVGRDETQELEIRKRNEQLQKIATVGRAASTIFHEINQPLSIMHMSTFFIRNVIDSESDQYSTASREELYQNLDIIESQINRSAQIISNLRLFHSSDKKKLVAEAINVRTLVEETIINIGQDIEDNRIDLEIDLSHGDACVWGNKTLFVQVLVNIVKNGIQALNERCQVESYRKISIRSALVDDAVVVKVEDNGPGMPQQSLARATEPFYTTREEGSGLGLALCLDILNSYGGRLSLENIRPHGLRVAMSFRQKPGE